MAAHMQTTAKGPAEVFPELSEPGIYAPERAFIVHVI
jgi:hypothetical protein